jgi:hypothetical protein
VKRGCGSFQTSTCMYKLHNFLMEQANFTWKLTTNSKSNADIEEECRDSCYESCILVMVRGKDSPWIEGIYVGQVLIGYISKLQNSY